MVFAAALLISSFNVLAYFTPDNRYIETNQVDPKKIGIKSTGNKKNLVLIYLESLEDGCSDETVFGRNLLKKLDNLEGFSFDLRQINIVSFTIASVIATQ